MKQELHHVAWVIENGRVTEAYQDGRYILPNLYGMVKVRIPLWYRICSFFRTYTIEKWRKGNRVPT